MLGRLEEAGGGDPEGQPHPLWPNGSRLPTLRRSSNCGCSTVQDFILQIFPDRMVVSCVCWGLQSQDPNLPLRSGFGIGAEFPPVETPCMEFPRLVAIAFRPPSRPPTHWTVRCSTQWISPRGSLHAALPCSPPCRRQHPLLYCLHPCSHSSCINFGAISL